MSWRWYFPSFLQIICTYYIILGKNLKFFILRNKKWQGRREGEGKGKEEKKKKKKKVGLHIHTARVTLVSWRSQFSKYMANPHGQVLNPWQVSLGGYRRWRNAELLTVCVLVFRKKQNIIAMYLESYACTLNLTWPGWGVRHPYCTLSLTYQPPLGDITWGVCLERRYRKEVMWWCPSDT